MKVSTPVATIGIRGTTVGGKAAVEGNENSFTLLQDADGELVRFLLVMMVEHKFYNKLVLLLVYLVLRHLRHLP